MNIDVKLQDKVINNNNFKTKEEYIQKEDSDSKINIFQQILIGTIYISLLVLSLFIV